MFLTSKHLEGCSDKTIRYYRCNIEKMLETIDIPVVKITTEMLQKYLVEYQTINECVVYGKGDKERKAYFDAKTKIHLMNYIESRTDNNSALFVSLNKPHSRLTESGVELHLREMGKKLGVEKVHPHKFRRTMATRAIEKDMPIEQVQKILGHEQIDTTLRYAMVNQNNVKLSHRKYIS